MIIRSIEFVTSAATKNQFIQDELPQIILSGRSNVGKSSFINAMLNNQKVARVSQTPGKTRLVNYIRINSQFYFVDLPGYGYAKVNHETLQAFKTRIETFLATSRSLRLAILLLDIRHMPTQDDMIMRNYLIGR
ncbi:MAG: ribosome biogenesis GTP-binding protein YsxC, partial [Bacilli bacterium]|nr:ribosome biogenesis GTP-binding protein YsxC [Bacilli bacterium]